MSSSALALLVPNRRTAAADVIAMMRLHVAFKHTMCICATLKDASDSGRFLASGLLLGQHIG